MKCTIDRAGRFVIPKQIRELAGWKPGVELNVDYQGGCGVLEPVSKVKLVRRGSFLVATVPGAPKFGPEVVNKILRRLHGD